MCKTKESPELKFRIGLGLGLLNRARCCSGGAKAARAYPWRCGEDGTKGSGISSLGRAQARNSDPPTPYANARSASTL
jgi:hypothetical protein